MYSSLSSLTRQAVSSILRNQRCVLHVEHGLISITPHMLSKSFSVQCVYLPSMPVLTQRQSVEHINVSGSSEFVRAIVTTRLSRIRRKDYEFCEVKEEDLEENFVRGSGPGGQSVNQTANCVVLKHKPSGIVVKCHETRSLQQNRQRARERLKDRLDFHINGSQSFLALQEQEASLNRRQKKKKNKDRLELKKAFKEREGIE